jgi:tRNA dimethylallyltransferase
MTECLIAIVGPTAVGKSRTAIEVALAFGGEIINADSRQVYRYMDIGTNKPTRDERSRVPHHLFDVVSPDENFNLALYRELAVSTIGAVEERRRVPLLVGGSGLYVWTIVENWQIPAALPDAAFRREMEEMARREGGESLHHLLRRVDPVAAAKIAPTNIRRLIRALEIYQATGKPPSEVQGKLAPRFRTKVIGLTMERELLYEAINARVDKMIELGFIDEVKGLIELGYDVDLPSMSGIGYRQIAAYLRGETSLSSAVERIKMETHRFARHQYAWFRLSDPRITWFRADECPRRPLEAIQHFLMAGATGK